MGKGNTEKIATSIAATLVKSGFIAYFAGGCVRDQLLGRPSEDWDIATSASPEEVAAIFNHTIPLGAEFGSIIVVIEGQPTEVTSFRSDVHEDYECGRRPHRIEKATPEEDAHRRSFTINGMFYDPIQKKIIDYVGGRRDLELGIVRAIGDPDLRFKEDRLRMIRGVRFAARFQFQIEKKTQQAIAEHAHLLFPAVSMERVWQELHKMAAHPHFDQAILLLHELGLLQEIFPLLPTTPPASIKNRVAPFHHFPEKSPLVAYLLQLFSEMGIEEIKQSLTRLKPSKAELAQTESLFNEKELIKREKEATNPPDKVEWVKFYAQPTAHLALEIAAASLSPEDKIAFLNHHKQRQEKLALHIDRELSKTPLVSSQHLKERGVAPGKKMGELLKEAERIAILFDLNHPEEVVNRLNL